MRKNPNALAKASWCFCKWFGNTSNSDTNIKANWAILTANTISPGQRHISSPLESLQKQLPTAWIQLSGNKRRSLNSHSVVYKNTGKAVLPWRRQWWRRWAPRPRCLLCNANSRVGCSFHSATACKMPKFMNHTLARMAMISIDSYVVEVAAIVVVAPSTVLHAAVVVRKQLTHEHTVTIFSHHDLWTVEFTTVQLSCAGRVGVASLPMSAERAAAGVLYSI